MIQVIFVLYIAYINAVQAYIFRLPCLLQANFTKFAVDHYFHGTIISKFESLEKGDCGLNCVSHDTCAFFNYVNQNKTCELFDHAEGDIIQRTGTDIFYATSIPMESYGENECKGDTAKFLDCSTTGYICKLIKNTAIGADAIASTSYDNNYSPNKLTDNQWNGHIGICWQTSASDAARWIMVDLGTSVDVMFMELVNAPPHVCYGSCDDFLVDFNITIGNVREPTMENALCLFNIDQANIFSRNYNCLGGITSGRYIAVKQNKDAETRAFGLCEIKVFAVDQQ